MKTAALPGQAAHRAGWVARVDTRYVEAKILLNDSQGAARWLNGRSMAELAPVLTRLDLAEKATLYEAAMTGGSGLGAGSRIAQETRSAYESHTKNGN